MSDQALQTKQVKGRMPTTRWTLVQAVGPEGDPQDRQRALEILCRDYWLPIYAYIRSWGCGVHDAEDLTQSFLAAFIKRDSFTNASKEEGRFRSWLLASLKHFLLEDRRNRSRLKRGGGVVHVSIDRDLGEAWLESSHVDGDTPEAIFERRWAAGLLERALEGLEGICRRDGRERHYEVLLPIIAGIDDRGGYAEAAETLGISEGAARMAAFRMRKRLGTLVREEVAATLASAEEIDDELAHFYRAFQRG